MVFFPAAALLASGLVVSASAASVHGHHMNLHRNAPGYGGKDDVSNNSTEACGVWTTYTTTWYGEASLVPGPSTTSTPPPAPAPATTSTSAPPPPPETTSSAAPPPPPPSTYEAPPAPAYTPPAPAPSPPAPSPPAEKYQPPAPSGGKGGLLGDILGGVSDAINGAVGAITSNGDKWGMTYTPYTTGGSCKSASDVSSDLGQIKAKGFTTVRLYATDCSGIQNVGSACKEHGLKLIMGIYIDGSGLGNGYAQVDELTSWGQQNGWDNIEMVVAGNEAIFNGYCSAGELAGFLNDSRSKFRAAGFNGPVTTTEPLGTIQENSGVLCPAVDVIAANIHPFFNGGVDASSAGSFVSSQLGLLHDACGGSKEAYNLETGWPSAGNANGAAVPGSWQQEVALKSISEAAGAKSIVFSFANDEWKAPGDLGVEQFWGCSSLFPDLF